MSAVDPRADSGRGADVPLRFGLDSAFRPQPRLGRREHVLYVGRFGREKGVFELIQAAARSSVPWRLHLAGPGPHAACCRRAQSGSASRSGFCSCPTCRAGARLAGLYGEASCVVMPGPFETFGLVALEAAASGARVVACETAPSAAVIGELGHTFRAGDPDDMLRAIEEARATPCDTAAARELSERLTWPRAFQAELADLEALAA